MLMRLLFEVLMGLLNVWAEEEEREVLLIEEEEHERAFVVRCSTLVSGYGRVPVKLKDPQILILSLSGYLHFSRYRSGSSPSTKIGSNHCALV